MCRGEVDPKHRQNRMLYQIRPYSGEAHIEWYWTVVISSKKKSGQRVDSSTSTSRESHPVEANLFSTLAVIRLQRAHTIDREALPSFDSKSACTITASAAKQKTNTKNFIFFSIEGFYNVYVSFLIPGSPLKCKMLAATLAHSASACSSRFHCSSTTSLEQPWFYIRDSFNRHIKTNLA